MAKRGEQTTTETPADETPADETTAPEAVANDVTGGTEDPALGTPLGTETVMPLAEARTAATGAGSEGERVTNLVDADEAGYLGQSPQRLATGRDDKGLSQANPAVMNGGE